MDTTTVYSTKAEKYAKFRWDYAEKAIETIFTITQITRHSIVADLGAGTGILTRHFATKAKAIYAIEPNFELRQILTRDLSAIPAISIMVGTAEATQLPDTSVDVLTVAQAIHWFQPEPARQEMMRILKNDGWLVLLRNYGTNRAHNEAIGNLMTKAFGADFSKVNERPKEKPIRFYYGNDAFQKFVFPFAFRQNWDEFIGSLTTASFMPDEDHPLFQKLETRAREIFARFAQHDYIKVEGETELIIGQPSRTQ